MKGRRVTQMVVGYDHGNGGRKKAVGKGGPAEDENLSKVPKMVGAAMAQKLQ